MASVTFDNATRQFPGNPLPSVDRLSIGIADGEFLVLVGPPGGGKSTSLRMLAGLEEVDSGRIFIADRDVTDLPPRDRDVAMVFQNYALYPHMSVAENLGFALRIAGTEAAEIDTRVREAARILDLTSCLDSKPTALSGGQRQRVAMGRAIVRSPRVFLMDEPLLNLDAKLRAQTRAQIIQLQRRLGVTTVYVTHDWAEAATMGDRIAVLKDGVLQQVASSREVYDQPANVFVASYLGSPAMNLLSVPVVDGGVLFGGRRLEVSRDELSGAGGRVVVGMRPEEVETTTEDEGFALTVESVEANGADAYVYATPRDPTAHVEAGEPGAGRPFVARVDGNPPPARGATIHVRPRPGRLHVFHHGTGVRLGR